MAVPVLPAVRQHAQPALQAVKQQKGEQRPSQHGNRGEAGLHTQGDRLWQQIEKGRAQQQARTHRCKQRYVAPKPYGKQAAKQGGGDRQK